MKKILFSILAVAAIVCGCARELEPEYTGGTPVSEYLVISADCGAMTKSDINEGKSTWEEGDKITVLYNGEAYEYVAGTPSADGKQTYFTSTAGISGYDGTDLVAYYEALDGESGTVGIAASRDIEFFDLAQKNPACAPLVGVSGSMQDGVLNMSFKNIFSVIELRIDPAGSQMTSYMKTLKIEPADGSDFEGYITCSGIVDASSLAVETSETGNALTLNFPAQADARVAQTLKFPVGRFSSSKGLKVTLTLEDGSQLVKNIYKSGITTYAEQDGNYSVMHLAKAMYAFSGGIACAQDLIDFAAAVNNGGSLIEYMNDEGKVVLLDDIDMTGVTNWTPIGNAKMTSYNPTDGVAFSGHFDGQGHSILNFKMTPDLASSKVEGRTYGLFGFLQNATVENLTIGAAEGDNSELTFSADGTTDVGVFAGVIRNSTLKNCTNYIPMTVNGNKTDNLRTTMAGFAGYVISMASEKTVLDNLKNYGSITGAPGSNTKNGGTSVHVSGIAGLAHANANAIGNFITNCDNYGNMTSSVARASGILASAQLLTTIENCNNYGDQTNTSDIYRIGLITCVISDNCTVKDCWNYGDLVTTKSGGHAGGLVCLLTKGNNTTTPSCQVLGGGNRGTIITDSDTRGLLIANMSLFAKVDGLVAGGSFGTYNGGNYQMATITSANYMSYIGKYSDANASKITNIIYDGPDAVGISTADELLEFASLVNQGKDYSKFCQNGVVVLLNDIDMTGKTWTPIGTAKMNNYNPDGTAFTGKFNGWGHSIRNIKLTPTYSSEVDGNTYGLFGFLNGATVENLVMGAPSGDSSELTFKGNGILDAGVLAGVCRNSTIKNCVNYVPMTVNGNAVNEKRTTMGAFAGYVVSMKDEESVLDNLVNYANMVCKQGSNTNNGGYGVIVGGIVGHAHGNGEAVGNTISNCVNYGNFTSEVSRTAGIVGSTQYVTTLSSCKNYGDQINTGTNIRPGMITCYMGDKCFMRDCENHGDLVLTKMNGNNVQGGGLVCLISGDTAEITGGGNYGMIIGDILENTTATSRYLGLIAANFSKFAKVDNVVAGGSIGTYNGGQYKMANVNAGNYMDYIGVYSSTNASKITNIIFDGADAINIFFIGNSFTMDSVTHLPGMLAAAGIKNVNMVHMYYGGRLMSAYNEQWATASDYTCYTCNAGATSWTTSTGKSLKSVAESRKWDIVTIQEHTGNAAAWVWNSTAKANFTGVINHIKESQADAQIYYIMSQAYQNMDKIGSGSKPSITWTDQAGMYKVITDFAQAAMRDCDIDGIIPTGTMLQNLRTTSLNNDLGLTRDGYHMDYGLSRYAASCTVFESIITPLTNITLDNNTYRYPDSGEGKTPVTDANAPIALQAARNAIATPYAVTDMSNY